MIDDHTPAAVSLEVAERNRIIPIIATELATLRSLAAFALAVLDEARRELGDLDGGWLQDTAEGLGLLVRYHVTERCGGAECICEDFPQDCLRYSKEVEAAFVAQATSRWRRHEQGRNPQS